MSCLSNTWDHSGLRGESDTLCTRKRFLVVKDEARKSAQNWYGVPLKLKGRGRCRGVWCRHGCVLCYDPPAALLATQNDERAQFFPGLLQAKAFIGDYADKTFDLVIKAYEPKDPKARRVRKETAKS
ncbi:MAG: hypothetical protein ACI9IV_001581 [Paracoccaceae bacterium]|jgi:hypothetical protein